MKAKLLRDIPTFGGTLKAGTIFDVLTVSLHHNGRGISGCPVEAVEFIAGGPSEKKPEQPKTTAPWIGPDATVKVPAFVPAAKAEEVRPPTGVTGGGKRAAKPAAGQKSMFDSIDEI